MAKSATKTVRLAAALKGLKAINREIRYADCFKNEYFTSGVIVFSATSRSDAKQIRHADQDVVCQVLKGRGRLRLPGRRIALAPGTICHIPKKTPHDFAAGRGQELVLFYSLIRTAR